MRHVMIAAMATLLLGTLSLSAKAQVLDQSSTGANTLIANIHEGSAYVGQTYTAGITGFLAGVNIDIRDLFGRRDVSELQVAIYSANNGRPTGVVLGSTVLILPPPGSPVPGDVPLSRFISFPQQIPQISGEQYAIIVNYLGAGPVPNQQGVWPGSAPSPYAGGTLVYTNTPTDPNSWTLFANGDLHFRTYVTTAPEPGTLALLGAGLGMVGLLARRRR